MAAGASPLRVLWQRRALFALLLRRELASRTAGTLLGAAWLILQPVLQLLGLWFFLDVVLRVRSPSQLSFTAYFLLGMVAWLMIQDVLQRSLWVMVEYAALYQRTPFPLPLLPLLPLAFSGTIYAGALMLVGGLLGGWSGAAGAAAAAVGLGLFLLPLSYVLAVLGLFIRETRQLLPFALTLLMYLTPILYMPELLPEGLRPWLVLNPLADLMALLHALVQRTPWEAGNFWRPALLSAVLWPVAWRLFRRAEPHMREAL